jgi:peptidoglycan biosynthesis protein MviN/MurJ (putative lipid II flippase)
MANNAKSLRVFLTLSLAAAAFVGILVLAASNYGNFEEALIWAGVTFIVVLVAIATMALSVKDENNDPTKPKLK